MVSLPSYVCECGWMCAFLTQQLCAVCVGASQVRLWRPGPARSLLPDEGSGGSYLRQSVHQPEVRRRGPHIQRGEDRQLWVHRPRGWNGGSKPGKSCTEMYNKSTWTLKRWDLKHLFQSHAFILRYIFSSIQAAAVSQVPVFVFAIILINTQRVRPGPRVFMGFASAPRTLKLRPKLSYTCTRSSASCEWDHPPSINVVSFERFHVWPWHVYPPSLHCKHMQTHTLHAAHISRHTHTPTPTHTHTQITPSVSIPSLSSASLTPLPPPQSLWSLPSWLPLFCPEMCVNSSLASTLLCLCPA